MSQPPELERPIIPDEPMQRDRVAIRLLERAANALGLKMDTWCSGWVVRLTHPDGRTRRVWGYNFDLNPSAGAHIARDKSATWELLRASGVAAVEHRLFLRPDLEGYAPESGSWGPMLSTLREFGGEAVIKPVDGSGGAGVWRVRTPREMEKLAGLLWERQHAICLSPYIPIQREVRHILLDGEPQIVYEKQIQTLVGDGRSSLGQLLTAVCADRREDWPVVAAGAARNCGAWGWDQVVPAGQRVPLGWKHNLRGALARVLEWPEPPMAALACEAAAALGLRVCAVDIIEAEGGDGPLVLEVNGGMMLERFVEQAPEGWKRAEALCVEVVRRMFL